MFSAFGLLWDIAWSFDRFTEADGAASTAEYTMEDRVVVQLRRGIDPPPDAVRVGPLRWVQSHEASWLQVPGAGLFRIRGRQVDFNPDDPCDDALRDLALAGPVANLVLRAAGAVPVHGAAVAWSDQIALLLGPAAIGTSTLATALHVRGFDIVGDDLLALRSHEGRVFAMAGGRFMQVPTNVVDAFGDRLPSQGRPSRPSSTLARRDVEFASPLAAGQVAAIYVLDNDSKEEPRISEVPGLQRMEAVLQADVHRPLRRELGWHSDDFGTAGVLTASLPVRKVSRLDTPSLHVGHLSKLVARDFKRIVRAGGRAG